MNLEIHKPELVQRVNAHIQAGHIHDWDELIERALADLDEKTAAPASAADQRRTGADLIAALQASPYRELDIEPPRIRLSMPVRDVALMAWLLDTNILSDIRKPQPEPKVLAFIAGTPLGELYISSVTLAKLRFGIDLLSHGSAQRKRLSDWLSETVRPMFENRVLPVSEDVIFRWRVLMEHGRKTGYTFSQPDLIIAATALQHGLTVVTRDRSDFDKAGVPVLNPWERR